MIVYFEKEREVSPLRVADFFGYHSVGLAKKGVS